MNDAKPPKDTRTRAQKIGDSPKRIRGSDKALVLTGVGGSVHKPQPLTAASRAKRHQAKDLALDYAEMAILAAVDMMKTSHSEQAKIAAIRLIIEYGLGKPTVVHVDEDGNTLMPNLIIISGEAAIQTVITSDYEITEHDTN